MPQFMVEVFGICNAVANSSQRTAEVRMTHSLNALVANLQARSSAGGGTDGRA